MRHELTEERWFNIFLNLIGSTLSNYNDNLNKEKDNEDIAYTGDTDSDIDLQ